MERFRWYETGESRELVKDEETRTLVAEEVADVMIYCLSFANATGIDVTQAIRAKLARNEDRFPVGAARGESGDTVK